MTINEVRKVMYGGPDNIEEDLAIDPVTNEMFVVDGYFARLGLWKTCGEGLGKERAEKHD